MPGRGWVTLFRKSVQEVITCLKIANADPSLIDIVESYLLGQGTISMESCIPHCSQFLLMSQSQDRLDWDYFVKGGISILLLECIHPFLHQWLPQRSVEKWGITFLKSLINLMHKQWIFWNTNIHHKIDGLTTNQLLDLFTNISSLLQTLPTNLLSRHRHLLNQDFHDLGNGETTRWQLWITSMESALSAASHVSSRNYTPGSLSVFHRFLPISRSVDPLTTTVSPQPNLTHPLHAIHASKSFLHHSGPLQFLPQQLHPPWSPTQLT